MRLMYKTGRGSDTEIHEVKVLKETAAFVTILYDWGLKPFERREAKKTDWYIYHETEAQALDYLIEKAQKDVERLKRETHSANSRLGELLSRKRKLAPGTVSSPEGGVGK